MPPEIEAVDPATSTPSPTPAGTVLDSLTSEDDGPLYANGWKPETKKDEAPPMPTDTAKGKEAVAEAKAKDDGGVGKESAAEGEQKSPRKVSFRDEFFREQSEHRFLKKKFKEMEEKYNAINPYETIRQRVERDPEFARGLSMLLRGELQLQGAKDTQGAQGGYGYGDTGYEDPAARREISTLRSEMDGLKKSLIDSEFEGTVAEHEGVLRSGIEKVKADPLYQGVKIDDDRVWDYMEEHHLRSDQVHVAAWAVYRDDALGNERRRAQEEIQRKLQSAEAAGKTGLRPGSGSPSTPALSPRDDLEERLNALVRPQGA